MNVSSLLYACAVIWTHKQVRKIIFFFLPLNCVYYNLKPGAADDLHFLRILTTALKSNLIGTAR